VAPRQGSKTLLWVLVGCGVLVLILVLVMAAGGFFLFKKAKGLVGDFETNPGMVAAKIITAANPDLEVITTDEGAGTITVRNKKTGEAFTVDLEEAKQGRIRIRNEKGEELKIEAKGKDGSGGIRVESDKGTFTFGGGAEGEMPGWLPAYPGTKPEPVFSGSQDKSATAGWKLSTADDAGKVLDFYQDALEDAGFEVSTNTFSQNGKVAGGMLSAKDDAGGRSVSVAVASPDKNTEIIVTLETHPREEL
jgi:hypothetical protein